MHQLILENSIVAACSEQISSQLDGEVIILQLKTGTYYGLDIVGSYIWSLVQAPKTMGQLREALMLKYEVNLEDCNRAVQDLLQKLYAEGLIEIQPSAG